MSSAWPASLKGGIVKMSHLRFTAAIFASGMLVLVGCGGSGEPSSVTAPKPVAGTTVSGASAVAINAPLPAPAGKQLTRAELIARADSICEGINKKRATVDFGTQASIAANMPALAVFERQAANELARLRPPAALKADYGKLLIGAEALASESARYGEYARTNDVLAESRVLRSAAIEQAAMTRVARRHRLKACSDL